MKLAGKRQQLSGERRSVLVRKMQGGGKRRREDRCATRDDKPRPLWTSEGEGVRVKQEGELDGEYAGERA